MATEQKHTPEIIRVLQRSNCPSEAENIVLDMLTSLQSVTQQLVDLHTAITDQGIEDRFIDDSLNMLSEGQTAITGARAAIARTERQVQP